MKENYLNKILLNLIIILLICSSLFSEKITRNYEEGTLEYHDNIPILTLKGDSYNVGLQYGKLLKKEIGVCSSILEEKIINSFKLKSSTYKNLKQLDNEIDVMLKKLPDDYLEEFKGMAKGADIELVKIHRIAFFPQVFYGLSCTSIIQKDKSGIAHGRNLDWDGAEFLSNIPLVVNYHIDGKIPFTNMTFVGYPGVYSGMNHEGLSASLNINSIPDVIIDRDYDMPIPYKTRQILEECTKLSEVDKIIKKFKSHGWFLTIASSKSNSGKVYELVRGDYFKSVLTKNYLLIENLGISEKVRMDYTPIWNHNEYNYARENAVKNIFKNKKKDTIINTLYNVLSSKSYFTYDLSPDHGKCINNNMTIQSCLFDNTNLNIYFSYSENFAGSDAFLRYSIKEKTLIPFFREQQESQQTFKEEYSKYLEWLKSLNLKNNLNNDDLTTYISEFDSINLSETFKDIVKFNLFKKAGDNNKASTFAAKIQKKYPLYYKSFKIKGDMQLANNDFNGATRSFQIILNSPTASPYDKFKAQMTLAEIQLNLNKIDNAKKFARKAIEMAELYFVDSYVQSKIDRMQEILEM